MEYWQTPTTTADDELGDPRMDAPLRRVGRVVGGVDVDALLERADRAVLELQLTLAELRRRVAD